MFPAAHHRNWLKNFKQALRHSDPAISSLLTVLLLTGLLAGCSDGNNRIPRHLVGVWGTKAPSHAHRQFELTEDSLVFETGTYRAKSHLVSKVEAFPKPAQVLYVITYYDGSWDKYQLSFYYRHIGNGEIVFQNQRQLKWTKRRARL